jgi:hypothetical protein
MATKKNSTPAVRYLRYELTNSSTPNTETSHYIDLAKDLSAINRRLYRQGRAYHVKRISIVSSNTIPSPGQNAGRVTVSTAPDSWVVRNAWRRGFEMWNKMNKQSVLGDQASLKPKFHDFKIRGIGSYAPTPTYLVPLDNGGGALSVGEWTYTQLVSPDGTTGADNFSLTLLGSHIGAAGVRTSVSLVKSYAESRATVQNDDPNRSSVDIDDPLLNLFDDGTVVDEVTNQLLFFNEDTPYDTDTYPGETGNMPQPLVNQQTTLGADGRATVGGFTAMCGLLELETTSPIGDDVYSVLVELAPGSYRGISAEVI